MYIGVLLTYIPCTACMYYLWNLEKWTYTCGCKQVFWKSSH